MASLQLDDRLRWGDLIRTGGPYPRVAPTNPVRRAAPRAVDFHRWNSWSPWEEVDPALRRTYSGPESGVGAHYAWAGNRKAGRGSMEITSSDPDSIGIRLAFVKPFKAENDILFTFSPQGAATEVTWRMSGEQRGVAAVLGRIVSMDRLVGKDFEKGLARLKAVAES